MAQEAADITTDLMYRAHRAIHSNIPGAIVFMPPPSPDPHGDDFDPTFANIADFIGLIYSDIASGQWPSQNPRDYFDGGGWHPYIIGDATQASWVQPNTTVYNVFVGKGDGSIPIIFSETGYSVCASGCSTNSQAVAATWMADGVTLSQKNFPWLTYLIYFRAFKDSAGYGVMSSPSAWPGNTWFATATSNPSGTVPNGFCYFTGCSYPSPKP